eukprot:12701685-Alexandrium_andersonii.AAC.1
MDDDACAAFLHAYAEHMSLSHDADAEGPDAEVLDGICDTALQADADHLSVASAKDLEAALEDITTQESQ